MKTALHMAVTGFLFVLAIEVNPVFLIAVILFIVFFRDGKVRKVDPQYRHYYRTELLSMLNPITQLMAFMQIMGHLFIYRRFKGKLPDAATYRPAVDYSLPFAGEWYVANGGVEEASSHSWDILTQRYAYDFFMKDEQGQSYRNDGRQLNDYYCYGQPILSPAAGKVVAVRDGVRDHPHVGRHAIDWMTRDFRGNFVVIQHAEEEFSFLAHLQPGSIAVKKGDLVERAQFLGLCGNSGHSTEPHLHFHFHDRADFWSAMGLPIGFRDAEIRAGDGGSWMPPPDGYLMSGVQVRSGKAATEAA